MILVDTNIIIDFWRKPNAEMTTVFSTKDIAVCGVVKAELLYGARSSTDCYRILNALAVFPCLDLCATDWDILGKNLYDLRSHGVTVPFQDAIIATTAMINGASIWTNDKHFALIKKVFTNLVLY